MKIKNIVIIIILTWAMLVSISFWWNYTNAIKEQERIALQSSRSFFDHIVITRLWNARHGGLYAPVTEKTQPNPYLDVQMREIEVNDTLILTKVNPAFMTRQISEVALEQEGVQFHITSLKPLRPQNKPTDREKEFLKEFENGIKENGLFVKEGVKTSFFYMAPLETKKACLKCHAKQGYKVGDVRGAISVTLPFVMEIPIFPLLFGHITIGLFGLFSIVIAGKKLNTSYEIIKEQAVMDALTGVPNRRSFSESILKEYRLSLRHKQPLSIVMCDVDNFKKFNDTYGHQDGDLCLKRVAQTLQTSLARPGDFCARYGGEEFVIILPRTSLAGAMHVAERIRSSIEKMEIPHELSLPAQVVTLSLGVTTFEKTTSRFSHEKLIKQADLALYKAKEQGRNQVQFFSENICEN
ncbi:MAG: diguanylate cyclase [Anaerolineaceae bacterium]|nr:diguanylate cyclase [Anaerolineaceae bacterium]